MRVHLNRLKMHLRETFQVKYYVGIIRAILLLQGDCRQRGTLCRRPRSTGSRRRHTRPSSSAQRTSGRLRVWPRAQRVPCGCCTGAGACGTPPALRGPTRKGSPTRSPSAKMWLSNWTRTQVLLPCFPCWLALTFRRLTLLAVAYLHLQNLHAFNQWETSLLCVRSHVLRNLPDYAQSDAT